VRALCEPVVIGARDVLEAQGLSLKKIRVVETGRREFHVGEIHPEHGRAALDAARNAIQGALAGEYAAVVAAPHSETAIHAAGIAFDGYPSFVARTAGLAPEDGILMLCFRHAGREVRIAHVTLHASVRRAVEMISTGRVLQTIKAASEFLKKLGLQDPRIAVSGVNPHAAGEEELAIIAPAIDAARREGITVDGPIGADTLVRRAGYDAYVVMLHDQGHVAAKVLAPNGAAALTIGTPVLFSSVAHGAAFDIAGRNRADPAAMVEAITRLVGHRRRPAKTRRKT
jgi:4-hydroxy-L-threonine phosphate dehydrogenase PdxA